MNFPYKTLSFILSILFSQTAIAQSRYYHLLVGTYTKNQTKGIFVYRFDSQTGEVQAESNTEGIKNPSFLVLNKAANRVYSVSEGTTGQVSAFEFDNKSGKLKLLNSQPTQSPGPCHVALSEDEKYVISSNYSGGSASVFPVLKDGSLGELTQLVQHEGSSIDPEGRQKSAHAHSATFYNQGKQVLIADLGADKIFNYDYDASSTPALKPGKPEFIQTVAGSGPRHLAIHPKTGNIYCVEELSGTVSVYTTKNQRFELLQRLVMANEDFSGKNGAADIHLSHDGKFLYASNRGTANEITIFRVNDKSGKLTKLAVQSSGGVHPRNFAIDLTDRFLLVANRDTNDIVIFKRDQKTGLLEPTGKKIENDAPVCLKFTEVAGE